MRLEISRHTKSLLQVRHGLASGNRHRHRHAHGVVQCLRGGDGAGLENGAIGQGLHPQHCHTALLRLRNHVLAEAFVVFIERIDRHLHRIEGEAMVVCRFNHVQVDVGALVAGEADKANLALFPGLLQHLDDVTRLKSLLRVSHANHFMNLDQVDMVRLEPGQGLLQLLLSRGAGASVELCHQESFVAIAVGEGFPHALLAGAVVVVPAVIEKINAPIQGGADDAKGLLFGDVGRPIW